MSIGPLSEHAIALIHDLCSRDDAITCAFSGAEDIVVLDLIHRSNLRVPVFAVDTGRLHAATHAYIQQAQQHYNLDLTWVTPDPSAVTAFERHNGRFSFYEDGHQACCSLRKTEPLRKHLAHFDGWLTGLRRDQNPNRDALPELQVDPIFLGLRGPLKKANPLANWSRLEVEAYIRHHSLPLNPLVHQGYKSIGCEPCTRALQPHEHERAGRWWWETNTNKECGLHEQPVQIIGGLKNET
jgi:phosphoadenosine phosphosulfate reductase|tara:strand:+ start:953 stop:1672 length:720 start_codon:yes stop_codon:yes gene_type:complete